MRIWLAQINSAVDDISGNVEKIMAFCAEAATLSVDVVVFHDMAVCGYPHGDLLLKKHFLNDTEKFPTMLRKRKIALLPPTGADRKTAGRIFKKAKQNKADKE